MPDWTRNKGEHSPFDIGNMDDLVLKNLEFLLGVMGYTKLVRTDFVHHITENNTTYCTGRSKGYTCYLMYKTSKAA